VPTAGRAGDRSRCVRSGASNHEAISDKFRELCFGSIDPDVATTALQLSVRCRLAPSLLPLLTCDASESDVLGLNMPVPPPTSAVPRRPPASPRRPPGSAPPRAPGAKASRVLT